MFDLDSLQLFDWCLCEIPWC